MVSRLTAMMIQSNEVAFRDTPERSECWILHDGKPHALVLSCPLDKRVELETVVQEIKDMPPCT